MVAMAPATDSAVGMLRHTVATLAYRGGKVLRGAPADFGTYCATEGTRQPGQILAHVCDLLDWAVKLTGGAHDWRETPPQSWEQDTARFFAGLEALDQRLASGAPLGHPAEKLFQGPIADALTHTGQIAMLRRMAGAPVRAENYFKAEITAGRVGAEQRAPLLEW
jgi:hypothetical protein